MKNDTPFQTYTINDLHSGITLETYLKDVLEYSSRKRQKLTHKKGSIFINNKPTFLKRILKEGDIVKLRSLPDTTYGVETQTGSIEILYEDEYMIILNKPPYKLVHPTGMTQRDTLANYLAYYFSAKNFLCTIRPLHRLDRDTSGCIVFAKSADAQKKLELQRDNGELKRIYHAVATGMIIPAEGTIRLPIAQDQSSPNQRCIEENGLPAVTHYKTLQTVLGNSYVEISLETGRTHQIRVHFSGIGHPLIGDKMYGISSPLISRQALHAAAVTWQHLRTGRAVYITAPLPQDMAAMFNSKTENTECTAR